MSDLNEIKSADMATRLRYITGKNAPSEAVSLYIGVDMGFCTGKALGNYPEVYYDRKIKKVISLLRKNGITAFSYKDRMIVSNLASVAVTKTGVRTPLISPSQVMPLATKLLNIFQENEIKVNGFVNPVYPKQMSFATSKQMQLKRNFHASFIKNFLDEVASQTEKNKNYDDMMREFAESGIFLYKGKNSYSDTNSYVTLDYPESNALVYATGDLGIALNYLDAMPHKKDEDTLYSFLTIYKRNGCEIFYGLDEMQNFETVNEKMPCMEEEHETPILKEHRLWGAFLVVQPDYVNALFDKNGFANQDTIFIKIPKQGQRSEEWEKFLSLHTPSPTEIVCNVMGNKRINASAINPLYQEQNAYNYKYLAMRAKVQQAMCTNVCEHSLNANKLVRFFNHIREKG